MRVASEQRHVDGIGGRLGCGQHERNDKQGEEGREGDHIVRKE